MTAILDNPALFWLVIGATFIAVEAVTVPGLGLFLAGLGAMCTALIIKSGLIAETAIAAQCAWFFGLTVVWAVLLWKPLQRFRSNLKRSPSAQINNIIGESATVKGILKRGISGQVMWSGTVMNAELDASATVDVLQEGAIVKIVSVSGTTLNVIPK